MFIRLFILFALPCLKDLLHVSAKADTVLVGPISFLILLDSLMVSGMKRHVGVLWTGIERISGIHDTVPICTE
jgi:hypothetical protein